MAGRETIMKNVVKGVSLNLKKITNNKFNALHLGWLKRKYLKHLPPNKPNSTIFLSHQTHFQNGPEFLYAIKEIFIEEIYRQELPVNCKILDCGAHIGISVLYYKKLCPSANIIAFEPDDHNYALLKKNVESHQLQNVTCLNEAVWTEDTMLQFIQDGNMGSKISSTAISNNIINVKATRLKKYLSEPIEFLKIDIEGAEYKVLTDIKESLESVKKIFLEYHGSFQQNNELLEMLEIVKSAGFKFYIKEAANIFPQPFFSPNIKTDYDVQLNIFCFR
jgi:FkbM family methyltransferase